MQTFWRYLKTNILSRWLVYLYLRLLFLTYRLKVVNNSGNNLPLNKTEGLYYLWREHMIAGIYFLNSQKVFGHFASDRSSDGLLAGFVAKQIGMRVMYSNGKPSFIRKALDVLEMNKRMYMVGDGTGSEPHQLQREIPYLGARTDVPLILLQVNVSAALSFARRWDKLKLPLPFSTITVTIYPPRRFAFDKEHNVQEVGDASCTSSSDS